MVTNATHQSKPTWQYDTDDTYRVRLFSKEIHLSDVANLHEREVFWLVANEFKETAAYKWAEDNCITLEWTTDDHVSSWHKLCMIYTDLTKQQYVDYTLRFFDHHNEAWK